MLIGTNTRDGVGSAQIHSSAPGFRVLYTTHQWSFVLESVGNLHSRKLTWEPKKSPIKTTVLLKGVYMGFYISVGECIGRTARGPVQHGRDPYEARTHTRVRYEVSTERAIGCFRGISGFHRCCSLWNYPTEVALDLKSSYGGSQN